MNTGQQKRTSAEFYLSFVYSFVFFGRVVNKCKAASLDFGMPKKKKMKSKIGKGWGFTLS